MVILAVNVSGNRAAKRNEAGARSDRRKKPRCRKTSINSAIVIGFASQQSAGSVEGEHPIEPRQVDDAIPIVERRIAYARPAPTQSARTNCQSLPPAAPRFYPADRIALGERIPAPPENKACRGFGADVAVLVIAKKMQPH